MDRLISEFCEYIGWSWEYCEEELTFPRLATFVKRWRQQPPLVVAVNNLVRVLAGETGPLELEDNSPEEGRPLEELVQLFGTGTHRIN